MGYGGREPAGGKMEKEGEVGGNPMPEGGWGQNLLSSGFALNGAHLFDPASHETKYTQPYIYIYIYIVFFVVFVFHIRSYVFHNICENSGGKFISVTTTIEGMVARQDI